MLKRLFALAAILVLPTLHATEPAPSEPIDVGVVCTSTEFTAYNFSTSPQLLVFHSGLYCTWRVLAPGTKFSSTYTRQMLDGVVLEIANFDAGILRTSHSYDLVSLCDSGAEALWVRNHTQFGSWLEFQQTLISMSAGPSLLPINVPLTLTAAVSLTAPAFAPTHVPVVTDDETPNGDKPPILDDKPLPPM
jgi:hypothetical protein